MQAKVLLTSIAVAVSLCAATNAGAANLILNGGFEGGVYTSTIGTDSNPNVPLDWTSNDAFDLQPNFNEVRNTDPQTGSFNLSIGNFNNEPIATLSQTFADVAGSSYAVDFFVLATNGGDTVANFTASVDGTSYFSTGDTINTYTEESFNFVGTGSDTLTLAANTNPGEWYVDNVSVTGAAAVSGAPEPSTWALMIMGVGMLGAMLRITGRRQAKTSAAFA